MAHRIVTVGKLLQVVGLIVLAGCTDTHNGGSFDSMQAAAQERPESSSAARTSLPDFVGLVEKYADAVVNVEVTQRAQAVQRQRDAQEDPLQEFFKRFGIPAPQFGPRGDVPMRGAGSGFIVSNEGYILTNAHVVAGADEVLVRLTDRREFRAKVVGADERTDIAVIKIDAANLPTVRIGNSDSLKTGEWVLAIGSPFGLEKSATAGIVSATSRAVGEGSYVPFIQTDVAVNPGNSGGPLFNLRGEVVGINSMIFSRTGGYMGLSFAIPIDVAIKVRDQLIKTGRVVRGRIGVTVQDMNARLADSFGLDRPRGALVNSVEEGGPAARAGVKSGDVILEVNGRPIERFGALSGEIAGLAPGSEARLRVWRAGKEQTLSVAVAPLEEPGQEDSRLTPGGERRTGALGLAVRPLTSEEKAGLGSNGLYVEQVDEPAASAGIQPGDLVVGINGQPVDSVAQLRDTVKKSKRTVALLVQRGDARLFVPIPVS